MGGKASYDTVITIKKYSNRRLYDMAHSRYLTIEELGELIQQGFDVQVVDSKTKEDITQAILTQIVMERDGIYLFSTSFLHQVIRNREGILGEFFTDFVPKMLDSTTISLLTSINIFYYYIYRIYVCCNAKL